MCVLHEVLGVDEQVFDVNEFTGHTAAVSLHAQRQANYCAVEGAIFDQRDVEDLLERLELVFEFLNVLRVVLEIEDGHVAAFVGRHALVRVDEGHLVTAEYCDEVGDVEERDELAGTRLAALRVARLRCAAQRALRRVRRRVLRQIAARCCRGAARLVRARGALFARYEYLIPMLVFQNGIVCDA